MPEMDGDEVLRLMKADASLGGIPVLIVSSEKARAEACLRAGAAAFLPKPIRADALRGMVEQVLAQAKRREEAGVAVLFVGVGPMEFGIDLESVRLVVLQPETRPLPAESGWVRELIDVRGEPVCVLDLARALGVEHSEPLQERKLVLVEHGEQRLALCVDAVLEPEVIPSADFVSRESIGGAEHEPLRRTLRGIARTSRGLVAVIDPLAVFSEEMLRDLPASLSRAGEAAW